ncbi:MAG TPA: hypothetical protein VIV60_36880 [Polyangiaceae bacterium]
MVWHSGFEGWKQAAAVPMLAVNLEQTERRDAYLPDPSAPTQPEATSNDAMAVDASAPFPDLQDAVSDEEAQDQVVDAEQVRELLVRTSRFPPERSIPPASSASIGPPIPALPVIFTWPRAAATVGVSLLGLSIVLLVLHWQHQRSNSSVELATQSDELRVANEPSRPSAAPIGKPGHDHEPPTITAAPSSVAKTARGIATSSKTGAVDTASPIVILDGPLTEEPFATQLRRSLPVFDQQCWDRLHNPYGSPSTNPSVSITLSVDRTGHVYDIVSSKAPAGYRGAGLCIIGRMRGWRFPSTEGNTHATVQVARSRR